MQKPRDHIERKRLPLSCLEPGHAGRKYKIEALVRELKAGGTLKNPLIVKRTGKKRYTTIVGGNRLRALRAVNATDADCIIVLGPEGAARAVAEHYTKVEGWAWTYRTAART